MKPIILDTQSGTVAAALTLTPVDVKKAKGYGILLDLTVATAAAKNFLDAAVNVTANTITISAHGYYTGLKVVASTTGTLPGGLSATDYYVIRVDADTIKLATSAAFALAGSAVDITSAAGGGTHTLTPAAISGASYKLQYSMDNVIWIDAGVTNNVTATSQFLHEKVDPMFNFVQVVWALSAGQIGYSVQTLVKEENY
jgi:hypothetical protein